MSPEQLEQHQKKKKGFGKKFLWFLGILSPCIVILANFGDALDFTKEQIEKFPYEMRAKTVEPNQEISGSDSGAKEANGENVQEVLVDPSIIYTYRMRVITYQSKISDTEEFEGKIVSSEKFVADLNKVLKSGVYDVYITNVDRKISEDAFSSKETKENSNYIYVYVNETTGTKEDMIKDARILDRKYKEMFENEGWLGSMNKWHGIYVDYSPMSNSYSNFDPDNYETLKPEDILKMKS